MAFAVRITLWKLSVGGLRERVRAIDQSGVNPGASARVQSEWVVLARTTVTSSRSWLTISVRRFAEHSVDGYGQFFELRGRRGVIPYARRSSSSRAWGRRLFPPSPWGS